MTHIGQDCGPVVQRIELGGYLVDLVAVQIALGIKQVEYLPTSNTILLPIAIEHGCATPDLTDGGFNSVFRGFPVRPRIAYAFLEGKLRILKVVLSGLQLSLSRLISAISRSPLKNGYGYGDLGDVITLGGTLIGLLAISGIDLGRVLRLGAA